ncbi:MAG: DUF4405 domain-containing protein, partial [Candidatus Micrarchaeia archaeon]
VVSISGLVLFFVLPGGGRFAGQAEFLGLTRHTYADVHNIVGLMFIAIMLLHILLHFRWILGMSRSLLAKRNKDGNE